MDPFSQNNHLSGNSPSQHLWAVGGGKGGVGKSLITSNLAISLALKGFKVVCIDLDLGGANLHTCLGVSIPEFTLSDYLSNKVKNLADLLTPTAIPNLAMISGAQDELSIANLKQIHKSKILSGFSALKVDYILMDLGAGTAANTLDFFISADKGILVVLPEPTSIENTYRFIKSAYYRRLKAVEDLLNIQPLIHKAMNSKMSPGQSSPVEMVRRITEMNPEMGRKLQEQMAQFSPRLIMNQVRSQADIDIGFSMKTICKRYFGIDLDYVGYLEYDACVWQSIKKRKPLLLEFPNSKLVTNFDKMMRRLLDQPF